MGIVLTLFGGACEFRRLLIVVRPRIADVFASVQGTRKLNYKRNKLEHNWQRRPRRILDQSELELRN